MSGFPTTHRELLRLVRKEITQTKTARAIMRKSGFRIGDASSVSEGPILTTPPCVVVEDEGGGGSCESMPTDVLTLGEHDFDMPATIAGTNPSPPGSPFPSYSTTGASADWTLHLHDAELVWLEDTPGADEDLIASLLAPGSPLSVDGVDYYPVLRLKASYTMSWHVVTTYAFFSGAYHAISTTYEFPLPLAGFRLIGRYVPGAGAPDSDDPIRLGTYNPGPRTVTDTDYPENGDHDAFLAVTHTWFPHDLRAGGVPLSGRFTSTAGLTGMIAAFNAAKTPQDADVSIDSTGPNWVLTVSHETDQNALYIPWEACTENREWALTATCCSWIDGLRGSVPMVITAPSAVTSGKNAAAIIRRILRDGDARTHYTHSDFGGVSWGTSDPLAEGIHRYPPGIEGFATMWDLTDASQVRSFVTVTDAEPGATIYPVWASTYTDLLSGDWDYLGSGIACDSAGFHESGWASIPSGAKGDVCVGFVLEVDTETPTLVMGAAEVRVR